MSGSGDDLLVQSRFKNLRLWELMAGKSAVECAANCGVPYGAFISLLNLSKSPINTRILSGTRHYSKTAEKIASHYNVLTDDLFPLALYSLNLPNVIERSYSSVKLLPLLAARNVHSMLPLPDALVESGELRKSLLQLLKTLGSRDADVIKRRFGLCGYREQTLKEIAEFYEVTVERVRQIEARALKKLRHTSKSQRLHGFLDREQREEIENRFLIAS